MDPSHNTVIHLITFMSVCLFQRVGIIHVCSVAELTHILITQQNGKQLSFIFLFTHIFEHFNCFEYKCTKCIILYDRAN